MQSSRDKLKIMNALQKVPLPVAGPALTRSEALFSKLTALDARALKISGDAEFFLFMNMRAEHQLASFAMNTFKWVKMTEEYNKRLVAANGNRVMTIRKHPRALIETLESVEKQILSRVARQDFVCESHLLFTCLFCC